MKAIMTVLITMTGFSALGAMTNDTNLLAIGQGISSPSSTSTVNYSSGYTSESPVGTIYQNGVRLSGQYDTNTNNDKGKNTAYGAELGYGQGQWGIAGGYRKADCAKCDGDFRAALGITVADIGVGFRFAEDLYAASLLFNPQGNHRFGLMYEANSTGVKGSDIASYGAGYSYVASQVTFTVDASKRSFQNSSVKDDRIQLTPGLMLRADMFQISVNDRIVLNTDKNNPAQKEDDHNIWFGIGIGKDKWHVALYSKYVNDLAFSGSIFF